MKYCLKYVFGCLMAMMVSVTLETHACTTAIVSGKITASGRPILWKNRDTSQKYNCVAKVEPTDSTFGYLALLNNITDADKEVWVGVNDQGFAIMNSQSYNLPDFADASCLTDQEGVVMCHALKRCKTVSDFGAMLDNWVGGYGCQANFGIIDAKGNGGYYEVWDTGYAFYPIDDEHPILIRSNFSMSGTQANRKGLERYESACQQVAEHIKNRDITPTLFTDQLSRDFYSSEFHCMVPHDEKVIDKGQYIPRASTTASIAIEGINEIEDVSDIVMWTVLGYPPCGETYRVTFDEIPFDLVEDATNSCPAWRIMIELKTKCLRKIDRSTSIVDQSKLEFRNPSSIN